MGDRAGRNAERHEEAPRRGRPPKRVAGAGPRQDLARGLTELLDSRGLTRSALAGQLNYRKSTVSEVFAGTKLPSRELLSAIVLRLEGDLDEWLRRWARARRHESLTGSTDSVPGPPRLEGPEGAARRGAGRSSTARASTSGHGPSALPDPSASREAGDLVGRDTEIQRLRTLVSGAQAGRSGVIVVRGDPGIGKSALLRCACMSPSPPMARLTARCGENEAELAFSALSALLSPITHLTAGLPGPQRRALEVALALRDPAADESSPRPIAIGLGTLGLLASAAPVTVVLDDAHWMDEASASALSFSARRLRAEGIALLIGVRSGEHCSMDLDGYPVLDLAGLGRGPARDLVARARGGRVSTATLDRLIHWTGGNPLALTELSRPGAPSDEVGREGQPPPLPQMLEAAYRKRLASLSDDTRWALLMCAASFTADVVEITTALGAGARADLEAAESAGLIVVASDRVGFVHPLIRSAVYHAFPPARRRTAHALLARVQASDGVAADHRAWHLAAAAFGPDEEVARALDGAAQRARQRSALEAAGHAYRRAAQLSLLPEDRARRLLAAAVGAQLAGLPEESLPLLAQARDLTQDPQRLGEIEHVHHQIQQLRAEPQDVVAQLARAAAELRDEAPRAAADLLATATSAAGMGGQISRAIEMAEHGHALAQEATGRGTPATTVMYAYALLASGRIAAASNLLRAEADTLLATDPLAHGPEVFGYACLVLTWLDEYAAADRLTARALNRIREAGAVEHLAVLTSGIAELRLRQGRWRAAYAQAARSAALADALGQPAITGYALSTLARVEAVWGNQQRCRDYAARALSLLEPGGYHIVASFNRLGLAQSELAQGHYTEAAAQFEFISRQIHGPDGLRAPVLVPCHADLVDAFVRTGRWKDAARALEAFAGLAGTASAPAAKASLARCRGMLEKDPRAAQDRFADALNRQACLPDPYALARTHLAFGERLRNDGNRGASERHLRVARDLFQQLGAEPWHRRAGDGLDVTAPRHARAGHYGFLTTQEVQVACLFAEGASEQQTADDLFLSVKTVDAHLEATCLKLGIRSRQDLADQLK